jgi:hypothetical protein
MEQLSRPDSEARIAVADARSALGIGHPSARFRAGSGALAPVDGQDRLGGVWGEIGLRTRSCPLAGPLRGTLSGRALPLRRCPSQTTPHKVKTPAPIANCYVAASAGSG